MAPTKNHFSLLDKSTRMTQSSGMTEIYLHRNAVDFRKSINGLMVIVEDEMNLSPFHHALFVFCNRGRDKIKALYWDERLEFCHATAYDLA